MKANKNLLLIGFTGFLLVVFISPGIFAAEQPPLRGGNNSDPDLYFKLTGEDDIFIKNTSDPPDEWTGEVKFLMKREIGAYGDDDIQKIKARIKYPCDKYEYVSISKNSTYWPDPGTIQDPPYTAYISGYQIVDIELTGTEIDPPDEFQHFATVTLRAFCQGELEITDIEFEIDGGLGYVELNNDPINDHYYPQLDANHWINGACTTADYTGTIDIADNVTGYLGQEILVPVEATTDFRMFAYSHAIQFENNKLEFVEVVVNEDIMPEGCSPANCGGSADGNRIDLTVANDHDGNYNYGYIQELSGSKSIYWLKFNIFGLFDNDQLNFSFINTEENDCNVLVYDGHHMYMPFCNALSDCVETSDYTGGYITIPNYEGGFWVEFDELNPEGKRGLDVLRYNVYMYNNFPAGDPNGNDEVACVFKLDDAGGDEWGWNDWDLLTDEITLTYDHEPGTDGKDYWTFYQINGTSNVKQPVTSYDKILTTDFTLDLSSIEVPYDDRFLIPDIATWYVAEGEIEPAHYTHMKDVSLNINIYHPDLMMGELELITDGYEFPMAEFFNTAASTSNPYVQTDIYIRNSFDAASFKVTIDVSGSDWCIDCIYQVHSDCKVNEIDGDTYEIEWDGASPLSASGDDSTKLGRVVFGVPEPCNGNDYYNVTPDLIGYAKNSSNEDQYVAYREYQITGKCYNNHGCGGAAIQSPCPLSPPPRLKKELVSEPDDVLPHEFSLHANQPNPFNPWTTLAYDVPITEHVIIEVYNIIGQKVITLVDEIKAPGRHEVIWDGTDSDGLKVASGIYLYKMQAGEFTESRKMMLMK